MEMADDESLVLRKKKQDMADLLKGGAIFEVTNAKQARIAQESGACAITIKGSVQGGVSRMADPSLIQEIKRAVSILVMAKARIGHLVEAQILQEMKIDFIEESEALTPADNVYINKHNFRVAFVCGCRGLEDALKRIKEGATLIRIEGGLSGSDNIFDTVRNLRSMKESIEILSNSNHFSATDDINPEVQTTKLGKLPVAQFAAGGIVTPADAALMLQLGCDGVFIGSEIFNDSDPCKSARAIVQAVKNYSNPRKLAGLDLGENRIDRGGINYADALAVRGLIHGSIQNSSLSVQN